MQVRSAGTGPAGADGMLAHWASGAGFASAKRHFSSAQLPRTMPVQALEASLELLGPSRGT